MSDVVLRSLLAEPTTSISSTRALGNKPVAEKEANTPTPSALGLLDQLKLSDEGSGNAKGRVPIGLTNSVKNGENKKQLQPLKDLTSVSIKTDYKVNTSYTIASGTAKVSGSQTVIGSVSFVDGADKTSEKLNVAIEKIQNWDSKINVLNSELSKQQKTEAKNPAALMSRAKAVTTAKFDAVKSRDEAITAYKSAVDEMKASFRASGVTSSSANQYKNSYDLMEKLFVETMAKDNSTMGQLKGYLKGVMTPENFDKAVQMLNPFDGK